MSFTQWGLSSKDNDAQKQPHVIKRVWTHANMRQAYNAHLNVEVTTNPHEERPILTRDLNRTRCWVYLRDGESFADFKAGLQGQVTGIGDNFSYTQGDLMGGGEIILLYMNMVGYASTKQSLAFKNDADEFASFCIMHYENNGQQGWMISILKNPLDTTKMQAVTYELNWPQSPSVNEIIASVSCPLIDALGELPFCFGAESLRKSGLLAMLIDSATGQVNIDAMLSLQNAFKPEQKGGQSKDDGQGLELSALLGSIQQKSLHRKRKP